MTAAASVAPAAARTSGTVTGVARRRLQLEAGVLLAGSLIAYSAPASRGGWSRHHPGARPARGGLPRRHPAGRAFVQCRAQHRPAGRSGGAGLVAGPWSWPWARWVNIEQLST